MSNVKMNGAISAKLRKSNHLIKTVQKFLNYYYYVFLIVQIRALPRKRRCKRL